jgi:hypothetical protein
VERRGERKLKKIETGFDLVVVKFIRREGEERSQQ